MIRVLFHKDVYMTAGFKTELTAKVRRLNRFVYSDHLISNIENARRHNRWNHLYTLNDIEETLKTLSVADIEVFEVEVTKDSETYSNDRWHTSKVVVRFMSVSGVDLVVVLRPTQQEENQAPNWCVATVVTAWFNNADDNHATLDTQKYVSKKEWLKLNSKRN